MAQQRKLYGARNEQGDFIEGPPTEEDVKSVEFLNKFYSRKAALYPEKNVESPETLMQKNPVQYLLVTRNPKLLDLLTEEQLEQGRFPIPGKDDNANVFNDEALKTYNEIYGFKN